MIEDVYELFDHAPELWHLIWYHPRGAATTSAKKTDWCHELKNFVQREEGAIRSRRVSAPSVTHEMSPGARGSTDARTGDGRHRDARVAKPAGGRWTGRGSVLDMRREYLIGVLRRALGEYQARERGLGQVSGDVESLIDSLAEVAEQDWVARLRHEWGTLEIVHALREAEGRPLSPDDQVALDAAVSALLELLPTADA